MMNLQEKVLAKLQLSKSFVENKLKVLVGKPVYLYYVSVAKKEQAPTEQRAALTVHKDSFKLCLSDQFSLYRRTRNALLLT